MASDEVVKWAGVFSPRLFTKAEAPQPFQDDTPPGQDLDDTTTADPNLDAGGNVGDNPEFRLISVQPVVLDNGAVQDYAYIGVLFNHDCGHDPDVPSNSIEYTYEFQLTPGQSGEDMFRDKFENLTLTPQEKMNYLAQHATNAEDEYDIERIRSHTPPEADTGSLSWLTGSK